MVACWVSCQAIGSLDSEHLGLENENCTTTTAASGHIHPQHPCWVASAPWPWEVLTLDLTEIWWWDDAYETAKELWASHHQCHQRLRTAQPSTVPNLKHGQNNVTINLKIGPGALWRVRSWILASFRVKDYLIQFGPTNGPYIGLLLIWGILFEELVVVRNFHI